MQQRLLFRRNVEVSGLAKQCKVRKETRACSYMFAKSKKLVPEKQVPSQRERRSEDNDQCRKNPVDSARVKVAQRKIAPLDCANDNSGDEVSGNNEEDVHADVSARKSGHACMEKNYAKDCERSQSIYIGPVGQGVASRICRGRRQGMYFPIIQ